MLKIIEHDMTRQLKEAELSKRSKVNKKLNIELIHKD